MKTLTTKNFKVEYDFIKDEETMKILLPHIISCLTDNAKGKFFSIDFVKKNGEIRHMVARTGVAKHLRGGKKTTPESLITVFDIQKKEYRCFDPKTVLKFKCGDVIFE